MLVVSKNNLTHILALNIFPVDTAECIIHKFWSVNGCAANYVSHILVIKFYSNLSSVLFRAKNITALLDPPGTGPVSKNYDLDPMLIN